MKNKSLFYTLFALLGLSVPSYAQTSQELAAQDSRRMGPLSGVFQWNHTLFSRPTPGIAFDLQMAHIGDRARPDGITAPPLGVGWAHSFETRVTPSQYYMGAGNVEAIKLSLWNGAVEVWGKDGAVVTNIQKYVTRHGEYRGEFSRNIVSGECTWVTPERLTYLFNPITTPTILVVQGTLINITDSNGNKVTVNRDSGNGRITNITDTADGVFSFNYNANGRLTSISYMEWTVTFDYTSNLLTAKRISAFPSAHVTTPAVPNRWEFTYSGNRLYRIFDPRGVAATSKYPSVTLTYDSSGRAY